MSETSAMKIDPTLSALFHCQNCSAAGLSATPEAFVCPSCATARRIVRGALLTEPGLEAASEGPAGGPPDSYEVDTKHRYQSEQYARRYFRKYRSIGAKHLYSWYIALREAQAAAALLDSIKHETAFVLDIPAGTGKLAAVHRRFGYRVLAADVSRHMLEAGFDEWRSVDRLAGFAQMDITRTLLRDKSVDAAVCLRLMHRLPVSLVESALAELARVTSKYLIVSNGMSDASVAKIFGRQERRSRHMGKPLPTHAEWTRLVSAVGVPVTERYVWKGVSKEILTLVRLT
jgi:SAM-dependent methyltransferase